jgi:hypothetical protein
MSDSEFEQESPKINQDCHDEIYELSLKVKHCGIFNDAEIELIFALLEEYTIPKKKKGPKIKSARERDMLLANQYEELFSKGHREEDIIKILTVDSGVRGSPGSYNRTLRNAIARGMKYNASLAQFKRLRSIRKQKSSATLDDSL